MPLSEASAALCFLLSTGRFLAAPAALSAQKEDFAVGEKMKSRWKHPTGQADARLQNARRAVTLTPLEHSKQVKIQQLLV